MMNKPSRPKLAITVPMANESSNATEFLKRLTKQIGVDDKIFCILDLMSKDNTKELVEEFSKTDSRVALIWSPDNKTVVDAYVRGYHEALKSDCEWILEMDAGLSHCPEEIHRFISEMKNGYDFVAGSRFMKESSFQGPALRYVVSRWGSMLTNLLLQTKMKDMTSGFECFTRNTLKELCDKGIVSRYSFFQTEIRYKMHKKKWKEVPISYKNPSGKFTFDVALDAVKGFFRLIRLNYFK